MTRAELLASVFGVSADDLPTPYRTVELQEGEHVVSHVEMYLSRVRVRLDQPQGGEIAESATTIPLVRLARVCTDPGRRGQGYASAMIRRAHSELREHRPIKFSAVQAGDAAPFFERCGYRRPEGAPDGFLVFELDDETWPSGRIRMVEEWR